MNIFLVVLLIHALSPISLAQNSVKEVIDGVRYKFARPGEVNINLVCETTNVESADFCTFTR